MKQPEILDEWYLTEHEPELLAQHDELLSLRLNYYTAYAVIFILSEEMGFKLNDIEVLFARRKKEICGVCQTRVDKKALKYKHRIIMYKGYYTLGVLLHEIAHVLSFQRRRFGTCKTMHGCRFKGWFIVVVRMMDRLAKTDPFVKGLWNETC